MPAKEQSLPTTSSDAEVDAFLQIAAEKRATAGVTECGRLIFAIDATASREPTWEQACQIQAEMFSQTTALGGLEVQLCYYRGFLEFEHSAWISDSHTLLTTMTQVKCAGGTTQIARVLEHAIREKNLGGVSTLVFVGDCVEEKVDRLCQLAGTLGLVGVPAFVFQESNDAVAESAFRQIARLSKGIYCRFDANSPKHLRELLGAAAVYAAGGERALEQYAKRDSTIVRRLTDQFSSSS